MEPVPKNSTQRLGFLEKINGILEPLINNSIHRTRTIGTTTQTIVTKTTTRTIVTTTKDRFKQNLDSWNPYNKLNGISEPVPRTVHRQWTFGTQVIT